MTERYYSQSGSNPEIQMCMHMAGPQMADQIPEQVRTLLASDEGIKSVSIIYNYGLGDRICVYQEIPDKE